MTATSSSLRPQREKCVSAGILHVPLPSPKSRRVLYIGCPRSPRCHQNIWSQLRALNKTRTVRFRLFPEMERPGNWLQCLTILTLKKFCLMLIQNFLYFGLVPQPLATHIFTQLGIYTYWQDPPRASPPLFEAKQSQCSEPLFTWQQSHAQHTRHVPPTPSRGKNHLPPPTGNALPNTDEDAVGVLNCEGGLPAHRPLVHHDNPRCFSAKLLASRSAPSPHWRVELSLPGTGLHTALRWTP